MRIGIEASPMFLHRGGIGYYTDCLIKNLLHIDKENEYVLYTSVNPQKTSSDAQFLNADNVHLVNVWRWAMKWQAKRDGIDVFHGPNYRLPARGLKRSVVTVHDLAVQRLPQLFIKRTGWQRDFNKNKRVVDQADRIIAVSKNTAHDIVEFYGVPREKIVVIYNGISEKFFPEMDQERIKKVRMQYKIGSRDYLLFVGGANPRKNLVTLLPVFALIQTVYRDLLLVLVGEMARGAQQVYRMIDNLNLQNSIIVADSVSIEDLRVLYSQASVFVYPSLYEGFGIPVIEAMACGAPVIASNTSSIPEVAGDAAMLIDPHDSGQLHISILKVIEGNQLREELVRKGLKHSRSFSWEKAACETLQLYEDIIRIP